MITFDNLMLKAFIDENKEFITGARINKIQQPTRRELIFLMRNNGITKQFYINICPQMYHVCFISETNYKKRLLEIPQKPPMFCMLLRKYLNNSKIAKINQPEGERILELFFETHNEIGDKIYLCLAIELMGKYSNVILYNTDTNIILGCAHNVGADKSQKREVYGQIPYTYPPKHLDNNFIFQRYGFLKSFKKEIFSSNINEIIDNYYSQIISRNKFKSLKSEYISLISQKLKKCTNSLKEINKQVQKYSDSDKYRLYGDLLMANLYNLKDYSKEAIVFDYENNKEITVLLNETKTVKENANDYYKKYNKSKTAVVKLDELSDKNQQDLDYLKSVLYSVEIVQNIDELKEIEKEIKSENIKIPNQVRNDQLVTVTEIIKDSNTRIYIGKNNRQNDYIISKLASDEDLWFHTKDCPGSHVLLKAQNPPDELILECAKLAKQYSSGANSSKIGVIYTKRKYLRKPPKANLGYVTYKNEKEIVID